jgi:hypothetical protein
LEEKEVSFMNSVREPKDSQKPIKRVLRRQDSGEYLMDGGWTNLLDEAINFDDAFEAVEICVRLGLKDIDLVLRVPSGDIFCSPLR